MTLIEMVEKAEEYATSQTSDNYDWQLIRDERMASLIRTDEREKVIDIVMHALFTASMSQEDFDGEKGVSIKALAFQICSEIRARKDEQ